jgi:hypothetical protein
MAIHRFVAASQSSCADVLRPVGATPLTAWIFPSTKSLTQKPVAHALVV